MAVSSLCRPVQLGELKGFTPYHSLLDYTFSFNYLGVVFYALVCELCACGSQCDCGVGYVLSLVKGWEPKLLSMCVAFDWLGFHG